MAIVKYKNQSGVTYAYESISEWDPAKKQSRPKRKYLGRVDMETGEIIPTAGKRGRPKKDATTNAPSSDYKALYKSASADLEKAQAAIRRMEQESEALRMENRRMREAILSIYKQAGMFTKDS